MILFVIDSRERERPPRHMAWDHTYIHGNQIYTTGGDTAFHCCNRDSQQLDLRHDIFARRLGNIKCPSFVWSRHSRRSLLIIDHRRIHSPQRPCTWIEIIVDITNTLYTRYILNQKWLSIQFTMNRFLCATVVIAAALLIVSVAADAELDSVDKVEQVADEVQSTDVEEGRIRKHHLLYGGLRKLIDLFIDIACMITLRQRIIYIFSWWRTWWLAHLGGFVRDQG